MDLVLWLVPVAAVAVLVIVLLARGGDAADGVKQRPQPGKALGATDLDRFLEEVNRRRRAAESQAPPPRAVPRPEASAEPPRRRPRRLEVVAEPPPVVLAVVEEKPAPPPPPIVVAVAEPAQHPLLRLLQTRDGVRTAILLHEVFGPPRSKQRR